MQGQGTGEDCWETSYWYTRSFTGSLMLHAGPTPPLDELLVLEPELPLEPELLLEDDVEPVSGLAASAGGVVPLSVAGADADGGGSFAPASSGSVVFASATVSPSPSSGDVAQADAAEMRAMRDSAPTHVRVERRMVATLAAELCTWRAGRFPRR